MSKLTAKLEELQELVRWFESDEMDIDAAMEKYKEVKKLAADIETSLAEIETQVKVVRDEFEQ